MYRQQAGNRVLMCSDLDLPVPEYLSTLVGIEAKCTEKSLV